MNLLAHIRVAVAVSPDPAFWLGAALPDLQREAGVAIGDGWPDAVQRGVECHRAADAVFHDLDMFRRGSAALTAALLASDVPRGAARGIGHAGWELLFDGALTDDAALMDAYAQAMAVDAPDPAWRAALDRRVARGVPRFYGDPASVAELLWRVLSSRRLLAFDRAHLDAVTRCLSAAQPTIADSIDAVFAAVTPAGG